MNPNSTDLEVTRVLGAITEFRLLYAAGKICGFEAVCDDWTVNVYVGTYETGEYIEGCARKGDVVVRLLPEQAQHLRDQLPKHLPLPGTTT